MSSLRHWWRSSRWVVLIALTAGCAAFGAVGAYGVTRPAEFQARFTLVAASTGRTTGSGTDLESLTTLVLPSLTEILRSPEVLSQVSRDVPSAGRPSELFSEVATEVIPNSGVARVTVTARDPGQARAVAASLAAEVTRLQLLAPAGVFRVFGPGSAAQTAPDTRLALGFSLATGVVVAVLAGGLVALRNRALSSQRQVSSALGDSSIPVFVLDGGRRAESPDPLQSLVRQGRLVPVGPAAKDVTDRWGRSPDDPSPQWSPHATGWSHPVTLVAARGITTRNELSETYAAVRASGTTVSAVLLA